MTQNPVGWFEIYVQNMNRAKKFYESVFETKLERLNNPNVELWSFPMQKDHAGAPGGNSTIVYFICTDCAVQEARAVEFGGKIEKKKLSIGEYGFISLVYDTEGNMFGLHSMQ